MGQVEVAYLVHADLVLEALLCGLPLLQGHYSRGVYENVQLVEAAFELLCEITY